MRILVITDLYPPHFVGGYELQCMVHVEELARRGHTVYVLTSRWKVENGAVEDNVYRLLHYNPVDEALSVKRRPANIYRRYNQLRWAVGCRLNYRVTRETLKALRPDLAYVWRMGGLSITPVLAAQEQGIPIVFNLYDFWLAVLKTELCLEPNSIKRRFRAAIVGLEDFRSIDLRHILVCSRSLLRHYTELNFCEENITVIPLGVPRQVIINVDEFSNLPKGDKRKVKLSFVGRLTPDKGPDVAIEALAHIVREMGVGDIGLDIIGTGRDEYVRELKNLVTALGLQEHVQFLGKLNHEQVLRRYSEYDALLFPSRWAEPFGMTILEAMARGLPVIATDYGGPSEMISDGKNG